MSRPYNAFISYRHHPLDSRIAGEIQRLLEGFQVPASLRKQNGAAKIDRLFRDKTELPITSDINDDILQALADSEFLIVICSTHTGESIWVEREIREFLRTHSQENILTVLADGEPQDVIPAILQTKTQQITDENGVTREVSIPVEPLSCDFRQYGTWKDRRTARREELPRLAAKLLHCAYDDLCQRQRQQQMRRLTITLSAAAVAMACLTGYFLWSNLQIRENYEQALTNQSMYLSRESLEQLDEGNRMAALELALAALPSEEMDRPWLPQAEYALSRATNAYVTPGMDEATAVTSLEHSSNVHEFYPSADGSRLYSYDANQIISAWDTQSGQRLYTISDVDFVLGIRLACDDTVLVLINSRELYGYDSATGELLWHNDTDYTRMEDYDEVIVSPDSEYLYVQCKNPAPYSPLDGEENLPPLLVYRVDARTGTIVQEHFVPQPESSGKYGVYGMQNVVISPDGRYIAFSYSVDSEFSLYSSCVAVYDIVEGSTFSVPFVFKYVTKMAFTPQNDLILCAHLLHEDDTATSQIYGIDLEQQTVRWSVDTLTALYSSTLLFPIEYPTQDGSVDAVLCASEKHWVVYAVSDGAVLEIWEHPSDHAGTTVFGNTIYGIFTGGELVVASLDGSYDTKNTCFPNDITEAVIAVVSEDKVVYVLSPRYSNELLLYKSNDRNDAWRPMDTLAPFSSLYDTVVTPFGLLASRYDAGYTSATYYMCAPETMEILWQYSAETPGSEIWITQDGQYLLSHKLALLLQDFSTPFLDQICLTADKDAILFWVNNGKLGYSGYYHDDSMLVRLDLATGKASAIDLPTEFKSNYLCSLSGGKLVGLYTAYDEAYQLIVMDEKGGLLAQYPFPVTQDSFYPQSFLASPDGTKVLLHGLADGFLYLVDLTDGATELIAETGDEDMISVCWTQDEQQFAAVFKHRTCIYSTTGELLLEIPMLTQKPCSAYFYGEDMLLVACEDNFLYRYCLPDGTLAGRCAVSDAYSDALWYETADDKIVFVSSGIANVINTEYWTLQARVENCWAYLPEKDSFLTRGYHAQLGGDSYGYFRRYTLDELTALAREQLGDFQLDEVARQEFGLDYGT